MHEIYHCYQSTFHHNHDNHSFHSFMKSIVINNKLLFNRNHDNHLFHFFIETSEGRKTIEGLVIKINT